MDKLGLTRRARSDVQYDYLENRADVEKRNKNLGAQEKRKKY